MGGRGRGLRRWLCRAVVVVACLWPLAAGAFTPNDPYNYLQWNFGQVGMGTAWDYVGGGTSEVKVAVLDTGVAYENYEGFSLVSDLAQTNFDRDNAYDATSGSSHADDIFGHGTHVTGTVAQSTNNGIGVAGVAFNTTILPIKVFRSDGYAYDTDIASGIDRAIAAGADVINLSLGGPSPGGEIQAAIDRAYRAGILVVASAGNSSRSSLDYPAAYPQVLAVGATNATFGLAYYSNHTSDMVVAPGGDLRVDATGDGYADGVLQQYIDGNYWFLQGTSMATPHVSGIAALVLAQGRSRGVLPDKGPARVDWLKSIITSTTLDLGSPGQDSTYGYGLVRAENALAKVNSLSAGSLEAMDLAPEQSEEPAGSWLEPSASGRPVRYRSATYSSIPMDQAGAQWLAEMEDTLHPIH